MQLLFDAYVFVADLIKSAKKSIISVHVFTRSHDRFLFIDDTVYHFGASLKDLGKKWFTFSKMELDANALIQIIV